MEGRGVGSETLSVGVSPLQEVVQLPFAARCVLLAGAQAFKQIPPLLVPEDEQQRRVLFAQPSQMQVGAI